MSGTAKARRGFLGWLTWSRGASHWLWLSVLVIVADQLSKWYIIENFAYRQRLPVLSVLEITRLHNTGAAFSLLADAEGWQRWFFISLGLTVSVLILVWLPRLARRGQRLLAAGLALILGGALGNVIDRVLHGYVVDFIHVHYRDWYYPAFNVADSAITVGAALLILDTLIEGRRASARRPSDDGGGDGSVENRGD